jgi:GT2 family glycosyltransferase
VHSKYHKGNTLLVVPFFDPPAALFDNCLDSLLRSVSADTRILLIDDGSRRIAPSSRDRLEALRRAASVELLTARENVGIAATRNRAIDWAFEHGHELLIFVDSDCCVEEGFVDEHIRLHNESPDVACFGGSIEGISEGYWSYAANIVCWYNNSPQAPRRVIKPPLNLCTANLSVKLVKERRDVCRFDEQLETGEDIAFNDRLRSAGDLIVFSPTPRLFHQNRVGFRNNVIHQYKYGLHSYPVRFGHLGSSWTFRAPIFALLLVGAPLLVAMTCVVSLKDWLRRSPEQVVFVPGVVFLRMVFAVGALVGTIDLRQTQPSAMRAGRGSAQPQWRLE